MTTRRSSIGTRPARSSNWEKLDSVKNEESALVEQAPRLVVEAALEEGEPHVDVRDVGNRGDDVAARRQERRYRSQYLQRVSQVLKHVTQQDDVEGQARQLGHVVVDVEVDDEHVTSMGLGALRRLRVDLQPGHLASTRGRALW